MFQAAEITANTPNGKEKKYAARVLTMPKKTRLRKRTKFMQEKRRGGEEGEDMHAYHIACTSE